MKKEKKSTGFYSGVTAMCCGWLRAPRKKKEKEKKNEKIKPFQLQATPHLQTEEPPPHQKSSTRHYIISSKPFYLPFPLQPWDKGEYRLPFSSDTSGHSEIAR